MLINLTKVTRDQLQDVEREMEVLWVAVQQVDACPRRSRSLSGSVHPPRIRESTLISEDFKSKFIPCASERRVHEPDAEYCLGQSSAFDGVQSQCFSW